MDLLRVARAIYSCPTAPYHEALPKAAVRALLEKLPHVTLQSDRYGNLYARYRYRPSVAQSLMLVGHLDHPGFEVQGDHLVFLGGVEESYFRGKRIQYFQDGNPTPLGRDVITETDWSRPEKKVWAGKIPTEADYAMWDLPTFRERGNRIEGRNCDDYAAVVAMVTVLRELARTKARADVTALFTRAEEVGFHGALVAAKELRPDPKRLVISLEASHARGFAKWGEGVILRVGDRASIFHSGVTRWMHHVAESLEKSRKGFRYQRLLMAGGTCEATVFHEAGHFTGALAVPLLNYHNRGTQNRIQAEAIALSDWKAEVDLLCALATSRISWKEPTRTLQNALKKREQAALKRLKSSASFRDTRPRKPLPLCL